MGATKSEIKKAGANNMDAQIRSGLERMSIQPSTENYVLGSKAFKLMQQEAKRGRVSEDMVYWYMATMYALNPTDLASFANPTPEEVAKVRALILRKYG